jgi:high-affinity Fe2+/Pb2+ permease
MNERARKGETMRFLLFLVGWCLLLVLCWPLALLALIVAPLVWLVLLPFRLVGITVDAVFSFLHAVLLLPARLLGYRPRSRA